MTTDSHAAFDASRVYSACYHWMGEQAEHLDRRRAERVQQLMEKRFFRPRTPAEAERKLGYTLDSWSELDICGWALWDRVKALSLLANHAILAGVDVHVTAEMSATLGKHLTRELAA